MARDASHDHHRSARDGPPTTPGEPVANVMAGEHEHDWREVSRRIEGRWEITNWRCACGATNTTRLATG
jgi:hypothetical protein